MLSLESRGMGADKGHRLHAFVGWQSYVILDDADVAGKPLHESTLDERPSYEWLEKAINEKFPTPRWARKLDDFDAQGPAFLRNLGGK